MRPKTKEMVMLLGVPAAICALLTVLLFLMVMVAGAAVAQTIVTPPGQRIHSIEIVGLDCIQLVVVDGNTVVCVRSLAATRDTLLRIPDNGEYVDEAYLSLFWRHSDAPGRAYWLGRLAAGLSRNAMMDAFVASGEYKAR